MTAPLQRRPVGWALKRLLDLTGATVGLAVLSPALIMCGIAIRMESSGSALFFQTRVGRDGREFELVKFRTMTAGAPVEFNPDGSTRVDASDARVTRLGRFLRGGVDELPQLINVLRGEMSLVGPRPDMPVHAQQYTAEERRKLSVRPGITSLAAVIGRNDIFWKDRIAVDLRWMDRWSLTLDLKIMMQTVLMAVGIRAFAFLDIIGDLPLAPSSAARRER